MRLFVDNILLLRVSIDVRAVIAADPGLFLFFSFSPHPSFCLFSYFYFLCYSAAARSVLVSTLKWVISPGVIFPLSNDPNGMDDVLCSVTFPPSWYAADNTCLSSFSRNQFTNTTRENNDTTSTPSKSKDCPCAVDLSIWEENTKLFVIGAYTVTVLILATNILLPPLLLSDVPTTGLRAVWKSCIS